MTQTIPTSTTTDADAPQASDKPAKPLWQRLLPLFVIALAIVVFFASGLNRFINFDELARQYSLLDGVLAANPVVAIIGAVLIYGAATALAIPSAPLTIVIGLLFGWGVGTAVVVVGATMGASILFFAARSALAPFFRQKAGRWLNRFAEGFRGDAANYLLFLRLAPVVPFAMVNILPAIFGVPYRIFLWTTAVGIIPGVLAYTFAGEGLRSIVAGRAEACALGVPPCGESLRVGDIITREILIAFVLLATISLVPVVIKRWRTHKSGAAKI